jgi:hypothetical protein
MEDVGPLRRHLVLSGLMSAFEKIFGEESFSDRMQYILQNTILALLEYPDATMLGINKMLADKTYRNDVIAHITDPSVKNYWTKEFAGYTDRFAAEAIPAIQNKIGQFTSNPLIRNIIGQPKSSFDIRKAMDERKIIIVNLSKGLVGENNANLLGSMIVTKIYLAAMSRADSSPAELAKLPNFYLYVDEFQSFANKSFADILSEARKYKLSLNITHQYVEQMAEEVRSAVFGNVGTMIAFRVGSYDAELLEKEFAPTFLMEDIVNLGFAQIYLRLMIDGVASQPFSATTLPPIAKADVSFRAEVMENSRKVYTHHKEEVEKVIKEWHEPEKTEVREKQIEKPREERRQERPREERPREERREERREPKQEIKQEIKREAPEGENSLGKAILQALNSKTQTVLVPEVPAKIQEPTAKVEIPIKNETVKLSELKKDEKNKNKEATPEKRNALKEALEKVNSIQTIDNSKKTEEKTEKKETSDYNLKSVDSKLTKEVPEDLLRKVLNG